MFLGTKVAVNAARNVRIAKEASWIVAGQIATIVAGLVLVRVLTEYLDPDQYGQLALGLTVAGLVNQVIMGGITNGISRFYTIAAEKCDMVAYLRACRRLLGYATGAVVVVALVMIAGLFFLGYSRWVPLAVGALLVSVFNSYNASLSGIQNAARHRGIVAFHGTLDAWLKILLAFVMIWVFGRSSTSVVFGFALSTLLVNVSQFTFLRRMPLQQREMPATTTDWSRQMWAYSWPFSTWGLFTWCQQTSDRWALQTFASTGNVGLYAVVFQLGYAPIGMATGMATSFLGPILYQRSGSAADSNRNNDVHNLAWRITVLCLTMTAFAFVITWLLHNWIFHLLVAEKYATASGLLPWLILAGGLFAAGQVLALKLMSEMKAAVMTFAKIATAVFGIALNIFGALQFGLEGVVAGLVAFSVIYLSWMTWLAQHPPKPLSSHLGNP